MISESLTQIHLLPTQDLPEPSPIEPPGAGGAIRDIVGYIQWIAGVCIVGLFFGGIIASTAGRLWDHHGSGRLGARLIVGALALAVLYGIGYGVINQFAQTSA
ncbi:hypothetical protein DMP17_43935 [Pseudonocardia sp. TMWB2A]